MLIQITGENVVVHGDRNLKIIQVLPVSRQFDIAIYKIYIQCPNIFHPELLHLPQMRCRFPLSHQCCKLVSLMIVHHI